VGLEDRASVIQPAPRHREERFWREDGEGADHAIGVSPRSIPSGWTPASLESDLRNHQQHRSPGEAGWKWPPPTSASHRPTRKLTGVVEGTRSNGGTVGDWLSSRFACVRVRVGHSQLRPGIAVDEWLLIAWPEGEDAPTKYWLSTLPGG